MKPTRTTRREGPGSAVDWRDVHKRMEMARRAIESGSSRGPDETERVMRERARALAREATPMRAPEDCIEVVEFVLASETYAVELAHVRDVHPLTELTPMPCTPIHVLGIVNIRGRIVSVIDIKKFFDLPERGLTDLNKVIILRSEAIEFGILADLIVGTRSVSLDALLPSLPTLTGIRAEYLRGVTADRLVILDAAKLLSDRNIVVHEQVDA